MRVGRTIAIITALLGLGVAVAAPASAETGTWVAYGNDNPITGSTSKWVCGGSEEIATSMVAQVCAIRSDHGTGSGVQAAVIVRNNRSSLASASARAVIWGEEGRLNEWICSSSGVAAHSWSVCFGRTFASWSKVYATGDAKNVALGYTGDV